MSDYWGPLDHSLIIGNADDLTLTFSNKETGAPEDISTWTEIEYQADSSESTDTISVLHADIVRSDSGSGTTDRMTIPRDETDTAIDPGRYIQRVNATVDGKRRTLLRGTLRMVKEGA